MRSRGESPTASASTPPCRASCCSCVEGEKDEEDPDERMDPLEYADSQEAPAGGPSLDLEVADVDVEASPSAE